MWCTAPNTCIGSKVPIESASPSCTIEYQQMVREVGEGGGGNNTLKVIALCYRYTLFCSSRLALKNSQSTCM